jgi:hypothetical protein
MVNDDLAIVSDFGSPVLENKIGQQVMGAMRGEDISWQFGREQNTWHWDLGGLVRRS